jgi:ribosomal protein L7/L12
MCLVILQRLCKNRCIIFIPSSKSNEIELRIEPTKTDNVELKTVFIGVDNTELIPATPKHSRIPVPTDPWLVCEIHKVYDKQGFIHAIKYCKDKVKCGLYDAKKIVEYLCNKAEDIIL